VRGARLLEIPIQFRPRQSGVSKSRLLHLGWRYLRALRSLRRIRRSSPPSDGCKGTSHQVL
jgi:hypothetical protein